jgi:hypothetical protein
MLTQLGWEEFSGVADALCAGSTRRILPDGSRQAISGPELIKARKGGRKVSGTQVVQGRRNLAGAPLTMFQSLTIS